MELKKKNKIYPSSSGFMVGRTLKTKYSSACLRFIVAKSNAKAPDIDSRYMEVGALHEDTIAAEWGDKIKEREFVIKVPITDGTDYSGRCDFITQDEILETKASFSDNVLYDTIRKGKVNTNHLAQVVSYMIQLKMQKGRIIVGYYTETEGKLNREEQRELVVTIDDHGTIAVDGIYTGFSVRDQVTHSLAAASALESQRIEQRRPFNAFTVDGPCRFCPLRDVCDSFDAGELNDSAFITKGVEAIESEKSKPPKIKQRKKNYVKRSVNAQIRV